MDAPVNCVQHAPFDPLFQVLVPMHGRAGAPKPRHKIHMHIHTRARAHAHRYYLHSKCFQLWHSNVRYGPQLRARVRTHSRYNFDHTLVVTLCQYKSRYKLYIQQRNKLSNQLFLAKDSFCEPLLDLKKETLEVQNVALLGRLWSA